MEDFFEIGVSEPLSTVKEPEKQEDPIVMYIIVRESLNMSLGKTAIQVGHATQMLQMEYHRLNNEIDPYRMDPVYGMSQEEYNTIPIEIKNNIAIFDEWLKSSIRKVALRADEKEWFKLRKETKKSMVLVVDAGLTELPPNTETVIGLWPMHKSQRSKLVKRLQAL